MLLISLLRVVSNSIPSFASIESTMPLFDLIISLTYSSLPDLMASPRFTIVSSFPSEYKDSFLVPWYLDPETTENDFMSANTLSFNEMKF